VTPDPEVAFCNDKLTVPPGATDAEDDNVLPGDGVPLQGDSRVYVIVSFGR
jgi:hypothetical protein